MTPRAQNQKDEIVLTANSPSTGSEDFDVVIVGGGQGGATTAIALRQNGFAGSIAILDAEQDPPYGRPPLSKGYLLEKQSFEKILLRPRSFWLEQNIELRLRTEVTQLDHSARQVVTKAGSRVGFGKLVWATGGSSRRLTCQGADLAGVHYVRTRDDADRIISELPSTTRVVVIGGGYIGLEAASALRTLGKEVVILEALDRVLARVAGEQLSRFYESEHRRHGIDVRLRQQVECILRSGERASGVKLASGEVIAADMVIVGIGIKPKVEALIRAGAEGENGVRVDEQCRTSLPDVMAIGDCAEHRNIYADGEYIRLESVQNANDQGTVAAKAIIGLDARYEAIPWFWSNQFDLRLQTAGISTGHDRTILRGDLDTRRFSVVYLKGERMIAIDAVNNTREYVQGRELVRQRATVAADRLADPKLALSDAVTQS